MDALLWMLIGHAVADFPLQGDWLSRAKNPTLAPIAGESIWIGALISHAAIHAGVVKLATGSWLLAGGELVAHSLIDHAKCKGLIGYNRDQIAHVACKFCWASLLLGGI